MLSRAFSHVLGKGSKCPLDLFVQRSSAVVRFGSKMPRHFHHLLAQSEPAGFPLHNSSAAPPTATCILESDGTVKNSDDTPLDSTSGRSFEEMLATVRSVGECANQYELGPLLKKKSAPVCYVWCDVSPLDAHNPGHLDGTQRQQDDKSRLQS
jgi:tyrosyl-tRNA synthetase